MSSIFCPDCGLQQPVAHRHCVRCGTELPAELLAQRPNKVSAFYPGVSVTEPPEPDSFLRVSYYRVSDQPGAAPGAGPHVRFSVWDAQEAVARCVVSISESTARELADFLEEQLPAHPAASGGHRSPPPLAGHLL